MSCRDLTRVLLGVSLLVGSSPAVGQVYSVTELESIGGGFSGRDIARALNDSGQAVGSSPIASAGPDPTAPAHAVLWDSVDGAIDLGTLAGDDLTSMAWDINDSGVVVGCADVAELQTHAFIWDETNGMRDLGVLAGMRSCALGINDEGVVTGWSDREVGGRHAFIWDASNGMRDLGTLGPDLGASSGNDVSSDGNGDPVIAGRADPDSGIGHAFIWDETNGMRDLGVLAGTRSAAWGVNSSGQVVGWSDFGDGTVAHAFIWDPSGGMRDLTTLDDDPTSEPLWGSEARSLNDAGVVVGGSGAVDNFWTVPFVWDEASGLRDLALLIDPTDPSSDLDLSYPLIPSTVDINSGGEILANARRANGSPISVILTPGPSSTPALNTTEISASAWNSYLDAPGGDCTEGSRSAPSDPCRSTAPYDPEDLDPAVVVEAEVDAGAACGPTVPMSRARARPTGILGAASEGLSPPPREAGQPLFPATVATAESRRLAVYTASYQGEGPPPAQIELDLFVIFDGVLSTELRPEAIVCPDGCPDPVFPQLGQLVARLGYDVTVHTATGQQSAFKAWAELNYQTLFTNIRFWSADFVDLDLETTNVATASIDFFEDIPAAYNVPLDEPFGVELTLSTRIDAHFISTQFQSCASSNFFDTASVEVTTSTPGVTLTEIIGESGDPADDAPDAPLEPVDAGEPRETDAGRTDDVSADGGGLGADGPIDDDTTDGAVPDGSADLTSSGADDGCGCGLAGAQPGWADAVLFMLVAIQVSARRRGPKKHRHARARSRNHEPG